MFSEQQKAHAAGYVDAEGCLAIRTFKAHGSRIWTAEITLKQTQPDIVERFQTEYGGALRVERQTRGRPLKRWRLCAINDVKRFLADITPHLREKREQAELILSRFDPKADHATNLILHDHIARLKDKRLAQVEIRSRLAIAAHDPNRKCLDCGEPAFARDLCGKHYQKAKREGRITTNPKGAGVPFAYGRQLQSLDAPYFAGYFDGDGSLVLRPEKGHWYPRIAFGQTQPDVVIDLHVTYGGSLKMQKGTGADPKPILFYQLTQREAVLAMLRDVQPFTIEKRAQIDLLLTQYRSTMTFEEGKALQQQLSVMKRTVLREQDVDSLHLAGA